MEIKPVSLYRLHYVLTNLWVRGREELRRIGLTEEQAFNRFLGYAGLGPSAILVFDEPAVATGIATVNGESFTWFQATDEFAKHASAITRFVRRRAASHDGDLHIYSVLVHPETERWFRVLGFEREDWQGKTDAGFSLFRFKRK